MAQSKIQMKDNVDYSDKNSDPAEGVSLCIPRVFNNINYKRIKEVFIRMGWGYVERVCMSYVFMLCILTYPYVCRVICVMFRSVHVPCVMNT